MLKKIVKYGNSNALILDKALLELLNIQEGGIVKIKTDGTSLIITPHGVIEQESITKTITPQETIQEAIQQKVDNFCTNPTQGSTYMNELSNVFAQYPNAIKKMETTEAKKEMQNLEQQYNGNYTNPDYLKAMTAIRQKYAPELLNMDQQVQAISQKYASPEYQYTNNDNPGKLADSVELFRKIHEKYQHVMQAATEVNANPEYINESVLLAEKYQTNKNSTEYIQELQKLIAKYVPEYATYQNELAAVAESFK